MSLLSSLALAAGSWLCGVGMAFSLSARLIADARRACGCRPWTSREVPDPPLRRIDLPTRDKVRR